MICKFLEDLILEFINWEKEVTNDFIGFEIDYCIVNNFINNYYIEHFISNMVIIMVNINLDIDFIFIINYYYS